MLVVRIMCTAARQDLPRTSVIQYLSLSLHPCTRHPMRLDKDARKCLQVRFIHYVICPVDSPNLFYSPRYLAQCHAILPVKSASTHQVPPYGRMGTVHPRRQCVTETSEPTTIHNLSLRLLVSLRPCMDPPGLEVRWSNRLTDENRHY